MIPVNRKAAVGRSGFGLGRGNEYGYISAVYWYRRNAAPEHAMLRQALVDRLADLVETDPRCQQILEAFAALKADPAHPLKALGVEP